MHTPEQHVERISGYLKRKAIPPDWLSGPYACMVMHECYQPVVDYWRTLSNDVVLQAFNSYDPTFNARLPEIAGGAVGFRDDVFAVIDTHQFDEECAARILAANDGELPKTPDDVTEWLFDDFTRRREEAYLERARRDLGLGKGVFALLRPR